MRSKAYMGASGLAAALALLAASAPAAAAAKRITGKLSAPGYTVLALDADGEAASQPTKANGKFKLKPSAKKVTLHLRAADGTYAGPVVIDKKGKKGKKAILGVEAGAELGKVKVRDGYAKLKRDLPREDVDRKRKAKAKQGVPIGAGVFGRVAAAATGTPGPGTDLDRDGIPGALDVDDDGDLVLDNSETPTTSRRGQPAAGCGPANFSYCPTMSSYLALASFHETVNVNAGSDIAEINATLQSKGTLRFSPSVLGDSVELNCGVDDPATPESEGLSYCRPGGTGVASAGGAGGPGPEFPECCDLDGDGFGTIYPPPTPNGSFLGHGADSAEISPGDLPLLVTSGGVETEDAATLNYVFVTVPALVAYSDTDGNCAKVAGTPGECANEFSYPVAADGPGTVNNGFPVSAPGGEDVVLTLTFWRPQRQATGGDPAGAEWMDLGHLRYAAQGCPQSTLDTTDPTNLVEPSLPLLGMGSLEDLSDDQVSSPANTITYTLKLSQCLAAQGLSFDPGEERPIAFSAVSGATDTAHQTVVFERQ